MSRPSANQVIKNKIIDFTTEFKQSIFIILERYMTRFQLVHYKNSPFSIDTLRENHNDFLKVGQHLLVMHGYAKYDANGRIAPADRAKEPVYNSWVAKTELPTFEKEVKIYWKNYEENNRKRFLHSKGEIPLFQFIFPANHLPTDEELRIVTDAALLYFQPNPQRPPAEGERPPAEGERKEEGYKKDTLIF
jgi:hypothetical protein